MNQSVIAKVPETVRTFWHGKALGPYNLLGPRSFVDRGHRIELFTYDPKIVVPDWIVRRDANEIWEAAHVLSYQKDLGRGSFALHSNLFRYAMLHKLGGWWIDLDLVLLHPELPTDQIYFSLETSDPPRATFSVLKFPPAHPVLAKAMNRCVARGEEPLFGETGADLFTEMVVTHDLARFGHHMQDAYPIPAVDIKALFDPDRCEEVQKRCAEFALHPSFQRNVAARRNSSISGTTARIFYRSSVAQAWLQSTHASNGIYRSGAVDRVPYDVRRVSGRITCISTLQ